MRLVVYLALTSLLCTCGKVKIENSCEQNSFSISPLTYNTDSVAFFIPTAFTPNGDMLNDRFSIFGHGFELRKGFKIYKRNRLLVTNDSSLFWDGLDADGNEVKEGVYRFEFYALSRHIEGLKIDGDITLVKSLEYDLCSCRFEDMIDPEQGFVMLSNEPCN